MLSSFIKYFTLFHNVCATCTGAAKSEKACKASFTSDEVAFVQHVAAKVPSTGRSGDWSKLDGTASLEAFGKGWKASPGWFMGAPDESCTTTCTTQGLACTAKSEEEMTKISSKAALEAVVAKTGTPCASWATDTAPFTPFKVLDTSPGHHNQCESMRENKQSTCDATPSHRSYHYTRFCYCDQAAAIAGGHGDPHMVNINGERFDIWRLGAVELLRIPRKSHNQPRIRFFATVSSEHGTQSDSRCTARYMTAMRFSGSWFGNQEVYIKLVVGEMHVHVGEKSLSPLEKVQIGKSLIVSRPSESLVTVLAGNATLNVMHDDAVFKPHFYLNVDVLNLASLGFEIGGVLGLDDHTDVAQKPASCEHQFVAVRHNDHGSRASASLHA